MRQMIMKPELHQFETCREFAEAFQIGEGDLVLTNRFIYEPYFGELGLKADVIFQEEFGNGEPTDEMFEAICAAVKPEAVYKRVIGIGGGTVLDIAKLLVLKDCSPIAELYEHKREAVKEKKLCLIPTTCGTGSEVTNISILAFLSKNIKLGLAADAMYADEAVLIPQLLEGLPYRFFATSSIDALIHAVESSLSPKATPYTELFGYKAIEEIIRGYQVIAEKGGGGKKGAFEPVPDSKQFCRSCLWNRRLRSSSCYELSAGRNLPCGSRRSELCGVYWRYEKIHGNPAGWKNSEAESLPFRAPWMFL